MCVNENLEAGYLHPIQPCDKDTITQDTIKSCPTTQFMIKCIIHERVRSVMIKALATFNVF